MQPRHRLQPSPRPWRQYQVHLLRIVKFCRRFEVLCMIDDSKNRHAAPRFLSPQLDTPTPYTVVWSEALLNQAPPALVEQLKNADRPDLYLLLSPDTDWIDDGTRYHSTAEERQ